MEPDATDTSTDSSSDRAERGSEEVWDKAQEKIEELEQDPPKKLEDWPDDAAKYITFGGPEGEHSYEEGPEAKLGPSGLARHEDGSITIDGEPVDDPEKYRSDERVQGAVQSLSNPDDPEQESS